MSTNQSDTHRQEARIEISVLGPTTVVRGGQRIEDRALGGPKPRQLLSILATRAGTPVPKDQLAELLWGGRPPQGYLRTLESYVCLLRRALGLNGRGSGISTVLHGYLLDDEVVTVDLVRFRALARFTPDHDVATDPARLAEIEEAVALVGGELLASEPYAEWAIAERERFALELADAATAGAACALRLDRAEVAVRLARTAVAHDRFAEEAWRLLIDAYGAAGRRPEALRAYHDLVHLLADELATRPSQATTQRYLEVLRGTDPVEPRACVDLHDELRMLLTLLRTTVRQVPGLDAVAVDRGLTGLAVTLGAAS